MLYGTNICPTSLSEKLSPPSSTIVLQKIFWAVSFPHIAFYTPLDTDTAHSQPLDQYRPVRPAM